MLRVFKRCSVVIAAILAVQVFSSAYAGTYAQSPGGEGPENIKTAYITLDDGPSRNITPQNLDTLKKYGVKATFFVLPRSGMDELYKRIVEEGHAIGNHSYSHDYGYLYSSVENFKKDVIKAGDFIFKKTGHTPTAFRFPGGTMGRGKAAVKARADILAGLGYDYFDWNISTADTDPNLRTYGDKEYIVNLLTNNILNNTRGRKELIILMHDTSEYSSKALPRIIEGLRKQGYVFDVLTKGGDWQYESNENGEAVITGYIGHDTAVTVPTMLGGHAVTSIGSGVFTDDPITSIRIPGSVVNIDSGAFRECRTLKAIDINDGNPSFKSVDGVLFDITGTRLKQYPLGKSGSYAVPAGVNIIGEGAFRGSSGLTQVILGDSVSRIDNAAFAFCESLTDIYFLGDIPDFGDNVFQNTSGNFAVNYPVSRMKAWVDYSAYPSKPFIDTPCFDSVGDNLFAPDKQNHPPRDVPPAQYN